MNDWKAQLAEIYKSYSTQQKNKKGVESKLDKETNFRGKSGFNDTGIPLTPKAATKQRRNRSSYRYPLHLQRINERRQIEAKDRWNIKDVPAALSTRPADQTWAPSPVSRNHTTWTTPPTRKKLYVYYDSNGYPEPEQEPVRYIWDEEKKKGPVYKPTGKFPKIDEAIASYKKKCFREVT